MNTHITHTRWLKLVAFTCALNLAATVWTTAVLASTVLAQDAQPPAVVASLPAPGQPPAPTVAKAATEDKEDAQAAAEVATSAQVEQLETTPAQAAQVRELSVEPVLETRPMLPADRPAWVGAPNDISERIHRLYVASFTANTAQEAEADEMLDEPMVAAVQRYLADTLFPGEESLPLPITPEFVRLNLLDPATSYVAAMTTQSDVQYQKWVVLQITPEHREHFAQMLREHKQRQRMAVLGVGLAGLLGLTALANLAFNRRRRRYPETVGPLTMAIMPMPGAGNDHLVQHVAAGLAPAMVCKVPRKKSCCNKTTLVMTIGAGLLLAFVIPALKIVREERRGDQVHTQHIRISGSGIEIKRSTAQPNIEDTLSEHN